MIKILKVLRMALIVALLCMAIVGCNTKTTEALELEITSPADGDVLNASPVIVEGKISSLDATVTINGIEVLVRLKMEPYGMQGQYPAFSDKIELSEGKNTITVVARLDGQEVPQTITVTYAPQG